MNASFYPKLAFDGMKKNSRLYIPYILTCVGMVTMHYIASFLQYSDSIKFMPGAETISACMMLGSRVIAVFACLFLFYTNSFLMKRRKKEFGLYSVLGMNRKNISYLLLLENLFVFAVSVLFGCIFGIVFSKLAEAGLVKIIGGDISYSFSVSFESLGVTIVSFAVIFVLLFLNSFRQIKFADTVSLLKSENKGEKAPKANWVFGILGFAGLAVCYYIAVTINDPLSALTVFFGDVIGVIIATYLLFISGSVLICKLLQNSKKYYYKPNHFVSVSSMTYRMKRNGAGLASICILATMVLVMISSASCLFVGAEDALRTRYPREINTEFALSGINAIEDSEIDKLRDAVITTAKEKGAEINNVAEMRSVKIASLIDGNNIYTNPDTLNGYSSDMLAQSDKTCLVYVVPVSDYNRFTGKNVTLSDNECLVAAYRRKLDVSELHFENGYKLSVRQQVADFDPNGDMTMDVLPSALLFVNDVSQFVKAADYYEEESSERVVSFRWSYSFDTNLSDEQQLAVEDALAEKMVEDGMKNDYSYVRCTIESRTANRNDFYSTYGSVLFIGIMLSIVFIAAAVLIIYYKQISEGYEDAARFTIMKNVGMTSREIRKSINSQLISVFCFPLLAAGIHLAFAFPIINKLLALFNIRNVMLFAQTTVISFIGFAVIYAIAYKITSNAYYKIVSGASTD